MCNLCGHLDHEPTGSIRFGAVRNNDMGVIATSGETLAAQGFTVVHFGEFVQAFGNLAQEQYDAFLAAVARRQ